VCVSSRNPLPFFTKHDVSSDDAQVTCRMLTEVEQAKLGWRTLRLLKYLERIPIVF
jgi:hypothetical protein